MKKLALVSLFLAASCGFSAAGNWSITMGGGTQCSGTMSLSEGSAGALSGTWGCAGGGGTVSGTLKAPDISLNFQPNGNFSPFLMTGKATATTIDGTMNGSGFSNASFHGGK